MTSFRRSYLVYYSYKPLQLKEPGITCKVTCCYLGQCYELYFFYDHLVYVIIGVFCLAASIGLYSCL
ncbi:unnamed protein product, partial [Bubo scandiacus]